MHKDELVHIAVVVVVALMGGLGFSRLKQSPILGYILTGILLGPSSWYPLIEFRDQIGLLAELGVLLLLFVVGMELSLRIFKKVWFITTICVVFQIIISLGITLILSNIFGWSIELSTLLGFVMSLSSTAVVVKTLESIGELRSETGQMTIGILIAQDLAIAPMIVILRNLGTSWFDPWLISKLLPAIGLIVGLIFYLSRKQRVRFSLAKIIAGDKDLIPLAGLAFCFATAALSGYVGLSAPYGAFLAGFILGNTHERIIMLETTKPIQSTLMMVFFLSVGLLLDMSFLWENLVIVLILLFILTIVKTALNISILHFLRFPWSQAFLSGIILAQLGEFAFLLATVGYEAQVINEFGQKLIICLTVLSLTFSPLWLTTARRLKSTIADNNGLGLSSLLNILYGQQIHNILCMYQDFMYPPKKDPTDRPPNASA